MLGLWRPRSGVLRTQKLRFPLLRTKIYRRFFLLGLLGQNIALDALPITRNFVALISTFSFNFVLVAVFVCLFLQILFIFVLLFIKKICLYFPQQRGHGVAADGSVGRGSSVIGFPIA